MPVPITTITSNSTFHTSRPRPFSSSLSSSNSSIGDEVFRTEESNSFNSSILQKDITSQARIGASSSKPGHFVENLRVHKAEDVSKLWQSDGLSPHSITIELDSQTTLSVKRL
jgi:hypothetical protein